jgi:hypothetical protein
MGRLMIRIQGVHFAAQTQSQLHIQDPDYENAMIVAKVATSGPHVFCRISGRGAHVVLRAAALIPRDVKSPLISLGGNRGVRQSDWLGYGLARRLMAPACDGSNSPFRWRELSIPGHQRTSGRTASDMLRRLKLFKPP